MRKLGITLVFGVAMLGGAAHAQSDASVSVVGSFAATYVAPYSGSGIGTSVPVPDFTYNNIDYDFLSPGAGSQSFPAAGFTAPAGSGLWNSFVTQDPSSGLITFESSNAVGGEQIALHSVSAVTLGVANGGGLTLESTITPAGFGFYVANASYVSPTGVGCSVALGNCPIVDPATGYDFTRFIDNGSLASVSFDFQVLSVAGEIEPVFTPLYSVSSTITLADLRASGFSINADLTQGFAKLADFGLQTPPAGLLPNPGGEGTINVPYHSLGYNWSATPFTTTAVLPNFSYQEVVYVTRVTSLTTGGCLSGGTGVDAGITACLVAYSAFGDPIGQDVVENSVGDVGVLNHSGVDITGLTFTPFTIAPPRIEGGRLVFQGTQNAAVPEPATWAFMIMGFGAVGGLIRRRQGLARA